MATINDTQGTSYQILTPDLIPDLNLVAVSLDQIRKMPGGRYCQTTISYSVASGKTITLKGCISPKLSSCRYLQGAGVTNPGTADAQRVLTGSGTITAVLSDGYWTLS